MEAQPIFAGLGPTYTLFGGISVTPGVVDQITLQQLTVDIQDQSGRVFLSFSGFGFPQTIVSNVSLGGAFASTSDPDPTRAAGSAFVARVVYSRPGASARTAETRGTIVARRPPA